MLCKLLDKLVFHFNLRFSGLHNLRGAVAGKRVVDSSWLVDWAVRLLLWLLAHWHLLVNDLRLLLEVWINQTRIALTFVLHNNYYKPSHSKPLDPV